MPGAHILIVEDEQLIRLFIAESLQEYGFQVSEAENAAEAMTKLAADDGTIDAVVIDVGLPDKPGDQLADDVRAKWADLPIVIASGRDIEEFGRRYRGDNRVAAVGKPYTTEMLLDALRAAGIDVGRAVPG